MAGKHPADQHAYAVWLTATDARRLHQLPGTTASAKLLTAIRQASTPLPTLAEQLTDLEWREIRPLLKALVKQAKTLGYAVTLVLPET